MILVGERLVGALLSSWLYMFKGDSGETETQIHSTTYDAWQWVFQRKDHCPITNNLICEKKKEENKKKNFRGSVPPQDMEKKEKTKPARTEREYCRLLYRHTR